MPSPCLGDGSVSHSYYISWFYLPSFLLSFFCFFSNGRMKLINLIFFFILDRCSSCFVEFDLFHLL